MAVEKVNGGRRLDASYETDGDESLPTSGRTRPSRNSSFKEKSSVDNGDSITTDQVQISSGSSLERRERHRNPIQKAFDGFRIKLRNIATAASPTFPRRRRSFDGDLDQPGSGQEGQQSLGGGGGGRQRQRSNSESRIVADPTTERSPLNQLLRSNFILPNGRHSGAIGIHNHGNSCFLNAVIQCLSNSDLLVEYLLSDELRDCVNRSGQNCAITKQLVALIQSLWTGTYDADVSCLFKQLVGECAEQYSGTTQNDAQEFLLWLLDKVNEELCSFVEKDNESQSKNVRGKNNNGSIIFDLFEAKYRSTLTCPSCQQQSNTYDPFLSVSLPIQLKNRLPVYVTVAFMKPYYRQVLYGLMMNTGDTVASLKRMLSRKTGIKEKQLLLTQIFDGKFQSTLDDSELLVDLNTLQFLYAVELFEDPGSNGNTFDDEYSGMESVCIVAVNRVKDGSRQSSRFGGPFVVNISRDSTTLQLRGALLGGMSFMIPKGCLEQVMMEGQFSMRLISKVCKNVYLCDDDELPLYAVAVDDALTLCAENVSPHIMLVLEWRYTDYKRLLVNTHPPVHCDQSYEQMKASLQHKNAIDLQDCFSAFTQQEQLGDEDTWLCPNCHRYQHGTIKSLNLCSLPDIMIVHLKRFRQDGNSRSKLNTLIKFPISGLDMTSHLTKGQQPSNDNSTESIKQDDCIYDLYSVCNHDGAMSQGHYKAICKNPLNSQWNIYDDAKVTETREDRIVTRMAYLLFYRRRQAKSRSHTPLDVCISQLLTAHGIKRVDPKPVATSKSVATSKPVSSNQNSNSNRNSISTQSTQSVRSPNHLNNSNASFRQPANLSFSRIPQNHHSRSNSFHASLRKPTSRRIPTAQWGMDRRLIYANTSLAGHSTMVRSRTQPLQQKSPLYANGNRTFNGRVKEKSSDDIDFSSSANVLTDSAILEAVTKSSNQNQPKLDTSQPKLNVSQSKLIFKKVPNNSLDNYSNANGNVAENIQNPLSTWQQKVEKYVQESAV